MTRSVRHPGFQITCALLVIKMGMSPCKILGLRTRGPTAGSEKATIATEYLKAKGLEPVAEYLMKMMQGTEMALRRN